MTQPILFSSGIQLSPLVTSSGLLQRSWDVIASRHEGIDSDEGVGLSWKVYREPDTHVVILAFEAKSDSSSNLQPDLVPSSDLLLSTENISILSVNKTAVSLLQENHQKLDKLKDQLITEIDAKSSTTKLIVTGRALGGLVASLFTVSLLESIGSGEKRPLCVTFGSPLVGDKKLQQAISRSSKWSSCFLHVVSHKDPLPRLFNSKSGYMPFGTFLFFSDTSSTCFENPDSILETLVALGSINAQNQGFQSSEYGNIVENLKPVCSDFTTQAEDTFHSESLLKSCISLQLQALGFTPHMQEQKQIIDFNTLETNEKKLIMKRRINFDPPKKLNEMKGYLAQLEWYKKVTKDQGIGYYDSYKNMYDRRDIDVIQFHKKLTIYWEKVVEEARLKPPKEGSAFRTRYLYGGTTYRRMVEPLAISQYYKDGRKDESEDYKSKRSKHFELLEQWLKDASEKDKKNLESTSKQGVKAILTMDSLFWAHVEEALISCRELNAAKEKEKALKKLDEFEKYVYGQLKDYAVSPEIFLEKSSFMRWWIEYKRIKGPSYNSPLASFMNDVDKRNKYALGAYDFP